MFLKKIDIKKKQFISVVLSSLIIFPLLMTVLFRFFNIGSAQIVLHLDAVSQSDKYQLFYNTGKGYSESESVSVHVPISDKRENIVFEISSGAKKIKSFRIDPGTSISSLQISGISINADKKTIKYWTPDKTYFELLKDLGIDNKLKWSNTKMSYFIDGKHYPWGDPFSLLMFPKIGIILKMPLWFLN